MPFACASGLFKRLPRHRLHSRRRSIWRCKTTDHHSPVPRSTPHARLAGAGRAQTLPRWLCLTPTADLSKSERGPISTCGPLFQYVTKPGDCCGEIDPFLPLPMNSRIREALLLDFSRGAGGLTSGRRAHSPLTPTSRTYAGGVGSPALCLANGLLRDRDGLDRVTYWVGIGVSWKPIAATFRFSAFNMLAFVSASYSSIDCVTYSWPYLSIL